MKIHIRSFHQNITNDQQPYCTVKLTLSAEELFKLIENCNAQAKSKTLHGTPYEVRYDVDQITLCHIEEGYLGRVQKTVLGRGTFAVDTSDPAEET